MLATGIMARKPQDRINGKATIGHTLSQNMVGTAQDLHYFKCSLNIHVSLLKFIWCWYKRGFLHKVLYFLRNLSKPLSTPTLHSMQSQHLQRLFMISNSRRNYAVETRVLWMRGLQTVQYLSFVLNYSSDQQPLVIREFKRECST